MCQTKMVAVAAAEEALVLALLRELRAELVVFLAVAQDPRVGARGMAAAFLEVAAAARLF